MADKKNKEVTVSLRMIYKNDETGNMVVPFAMPRRDTVLFAPYGDNVASGREERIPLKDFLDQHTRMDDEPTVGRNI
jgi:hypothetical protein